VVNNREKLFEFASTSFDEIESMTINFKPYADLWTISAEFTKKFPTWTDGPFTSLDADAIEANVTAWWKFAWKAEKTFEGKKEPQSVAVKLKQMLDDFKPHLPIISALRNPGMRERHWAKLSAEAGEPIVPDVSLTLSWMLEKGIVSHEAFITQLSEQSAKEYGFERTLDKMKSEWKELLFDFAPYKDSGTYMLKGIEDTVVLLDDQIVKVQAMRGSPYAKPLEAVVVEWSNKLAMRGSPYAKPLEAVVVEWSNKLDVLEEWLKCQKTWLYLEPIFASPDIMRQMPTEGRRFQKVDQMWRATMQAGADAPGVLQVMTIEGLKNQFVESNPIHVMTIEGLKNQFVESNKALDMVQKGLNDYLETKRS
ncbi:dynein heavy chain, N-terminal region 2-domain-containing protein, partial [Baffinella frigidus]